MLISSSVKAGGGDAELDVAGIVLDAAELDGNVDELDGIETDGELDANGDGPVAKPDADGKLDVDDANGAELDGVDGSNVAGIELDVDMPDVDEIDADGVNPVADGVKPVADVAEIDGNVGSNANDGSNSGSLFFKYSYIVMLLKYNYCI